jgi:hypothetical protein
MPRKSGREHSRQAAAFRRGLLRWYRRHGRDLPWRRTRDPYHIVVSEFMLQQTQVSRVEAYYHRFLEQYPTIHALAAAPAAAVRESWEGLGYYRRATNLHRGGYGGYQRGASHSACLPPAVGAAADVEAGLGHGHRDPAEGRQESVGSQSGNHGAGRADLYGKGGEV